MERRRFMGWGLTSGALLGSAGLLPQVLRAAAPSLANSAIALFKDTSLVTVVSLYELTGSLGLALAGDGEWRPFYLEAWLFLAAIYWLGCALLARISAAIPRQP